ncbi:hypothetical protein [Bacillus thuringiensis]|uniref:hypothetical protein n=1 Tax=Bacillus thuringiensis TaxID=1428 RepID=UPI000BF279A0|nr:hypothetical protein [Bacillus thuringiensis]MED3052123.1 hypothetical protein [Bacillus thuringiensis]PFH71993.1 hypothetical protein COI56_18740 [Bacillus thuringiensis]
MKTTTVNIFKSSSFLENKYQIHFVDFEGYSSELLKYIEEHFVMICEGDSDSDIEVVKQRAMDFFESKSENTVMGATAEFFIHLYLKSLGYKQECTFFNLEEGSIKKGFDGYYSKDEVEWIMESKSGYRDSKGSSHWSKVKTAYDDLTDKFSGNVSNNPWQNAYNHAQLIDVGTSKSIRKNIKLLSDNFTQKKFTSIEDFNIIPASTIFLSGKWEDYDLNEIKKKIAGVVSNFKYKDIVIICVTKKSISQFIEFLNR